MANITFRNRLGSLIDVPAIAASEVKNRFGAVLDLATHGGAVAITKHDTTKAVLISLQEFEALVGNQQSSLAALGAEFDGLLVKMQTPATRKGIKTAFSSTPAALGNAAVKSARRKH